MKRKPTQKHCGRATSRTAKGQWQQENGPERWPGKGYCCTEKKEENQAKREQKAKARKEKQATKAKKAKEREESLRKKGERLTKNQPKMVGWFRKEGLGSRKTPAGGKTGVG